MNSIRQYTRAKGFVIIKLHPPQIRPSWVVQTTNAPPSLSTFWWNLVGFQPSLLPEYVNLSLRNSKFVFFKRPRTAATSALSPSTGSAHSSRTAGYCSGNFSLPNRFKPYIYVCVCCLVYKLMLLPKRQTKSNWDMKEIPSHETTIHCRPSTCVPLVLLL